MRKSEALKLRENIETGVQSITDENALETVSLFPVWRSGVVYSAGYRVRYDGILYRCITAHESQETWTPAASPSLWAKVLIPDDVVIPAWEQPDSTNAYSKGDTVTHNGSTWVSDMDNNVWEPGVYGWTVVQ